MSSGLGHLHSWKGVLFAKNPMTTLDSIGNGSHQVVASDKNDTTYPYRSQ
jgi:hypothetical protein